MARFSEGQEIKYIDLSLLVAHGTPVSSSTASGLQGGQPCGGGIYGSSSIETVRPTARSARSGNLLCVLLRGH